MLAYQSRYLIGDGLFYELQSGEVVQLTLLHSFLVPLLPHLGD